MTEFDDQFENLPEDVPDWDEETENDDSPVKRELLTIRFTDWFRYRTNRITDKAFAVYAYAYCQAQQSRIRPNIARLL